MAKDELVCLELKKYLIQSQTYYDIGESRECPKTLDEQINATVHHLEMYLSQIAAALKKYRYTTVHQ